MRSMTKAFALAPLLLLCGFSQVRYPCVDRNGDTVSGSLTVTGSIAVDGGLSVANGTTTDTLTATGQSTLAGASVSGALSVDGGATVHNGITATGGISTDSLTGTGTVQGARVNASSAAGAEGLVIGSGTVKAHLNNYSTPNYMIAANGLNNGSGPVEDDSTKSMPFIALIPGAGGTNFELDLGRYASSNGAEQDDLLFDGNGDAQFAGNVKPASNNSKTNGTSGNRWSTVYGVAANFSGTATTNAISNTGDVGTATVTATGVVQGSALQIASSAKAPVVINTSTQQAIEVGTGTLSTGSLTVTFGTAFSGAPVCVCSETVTTPAACSVSATSTTQATFKGTLSDTFAWQCIGAK